MSEKHLRLIWGAVSVMLYVFMIWALAFYFNTRDEKKFVHYVEKNENSIVIPMIELSATKAKISKQKVKPKPKPKPKKVVKKEIIKKPVSQKVVKKVTVVKKTIEKPKVKKPKPKAPKKIIKEKIVKKPVKKTIVKKVLKTNDLFSKVKTVKKVQTVKKTLPIKKEIVTPAVRASDLMSTLNDVKKEDTGIENAYLAKIESKLNGWPAQTEYAGQEAKVWVKIQPNGSFKYKVISSTGSQEFNDGLDAYLKQLQNIGFGRHKANRAYEINVEFVAKE
jgi:outer membrane biosynthesis protein TonB